MKIMESFEAAKSMTAGFLTENEIYKFDNPEILDFMQQKAAKEVEEETERSRKACKNLLLRIEQMKQIHLKKGFGKTGKFKKWSCKEMQAYL